jgi:ppGpp synthetase/RelA/SpoT-type nucleotidyltranferase
MSERVPAQNKTSATPSQATQASSPPLHRRSLTDEQSESVGSSSNISQELGGIQLKTIRRSLNWQNISVEAPSRGNGMSLPGGIQRQQEEQEGTPAIEHQVSAKKAETSTGELSNLTRATEGRSVQPKSDRGRLNWRNISVEAPAHNGETSSQPIQRQQEEQQDSGNNGGKPDERTKEEKQADLDKAMTEAQAYLDGFSGKKVDKKTIKPNLDTIKNTYKLKSLEPGEKGKYWGIHGEINPKDDKTTKAEIPDGEDGLVPSQEEVTRVLGTQFPDLANIINQLIDDKKHPLGLVRDIVDASRRQRTLALIKEMAEKKILGDQSFEQFLQRNPGAGLLFEKVPDRVNFDEQGRSRKKSFVEDQKQLDPARAVGADLTKEQENQVKDYARRLSQEVEPKVREEVETLANNIKQKLGGEVVVSVRTKGAAGLIDKVQRMVNGAKGRNVRSDYQIGDVIDAVGARITVDNTEQLTALLQEIRGQLGDRILEIENMYASPKSHAPAYRVIPMVLKTEINGKFYTFELQLNTMRASIAADLEHNTIFKPLVQVTEEQKQMIKRIMEEAAALDQLETKKV